MRQTQTLSLETPRRCKVCLVFHLYFYFPLCDVEWATTTEISSVLTAINSCRSICSKFLRTVSREKENANANNKELRNITHDKYETLLKNISLGAPPSPEEFPGPLTPHPSGISSPFRGGGRGVWIFSGAGSMNPTTQRPTQYGDTIFNLLT